MNLHATGLITTEKDLTAWEEAYTAVEAYLLAFRLRNRLIVAEMVRRILFRAAARHALEPECSPQVLAVSEAMEEVATWTSQVLGQPLEHGRLAVRGRLALLLANMPGRWQAVFLAPPPWPPEFIAHMRESYLEAAPRFAGMTMVERPLELNVLGSGAALWYETMGRRPILRRMTALAVVILFGLGLWFLLL
jgi:hypothetical protein